MIDEGRAAAEDSLVESVGTLPAEIAGAPILEAMAAAERLLAGAIHQRERIRVYRVSQATVAVSAACSSVVVVTTASTVAAGWATAGLIMAAGLLLVMLANGWLVSPLRTMAKRDEEAAAAVADEIRDLLTALRRDPVGKFLRQMIQLRLSRLPIGK